MSDQTGLILPPGVEVAIKDDGAPHHLPPGKVVVDNRTDLPDGVVEDAVRDYFVENASLAWGHSSTFQTYANEGGSLLTRTKFTTPKDVFDEIRLARDIAERDDDVRSTIGDMLAVAFADGMQNVHEDERTVALYNEMARNMNLDHQFKEIYKEYLVAAQVTTVAIFTRERLSFTPTGGSETIEERLAAPLIGLLPAEQIRVVNHDLFGQGELAYIPTNPAHKAWLEEFFSDRTTAARRAAMRTEDPVSAVLFTGPVEADDHNEITGRKAWAYKLNERMAKRATMPKGSHAYPRPLLTANFALIEAKRLLNIMDYALLQGGANFIVVAKKGTDQHRATQTELDSLGDTVRRASKTGVIIGDHRLSFEIITPDLTELLNADKRVLLGGKLTSLILRIPQAALVDDDFQVPLELMTRVITSDRNDIRRHVESAIYVEAAKRNSRLFKGDAPKIWHPKIILQGANFFTDFVLKLRDRGDIPRKYAVEAAGFDWEAGIAQRKRERAEDTDRIMAPAQVPFSSPAAGPQDNGPGRPTGSGPNNGAPGARQGPGSDPFQRRTIIQRNRGETIRAWWDEEEGASVRVGEVTFALLEQYPDRTDGRITAFERRALEGEEQATEGAVTVVPVNVGYDCHDLRAVNLAPGLRMILGYRNDDDAVVAQALSFREPEFDPLDAEELAMRVGFRLTEEADRSMVKRVRRDEEGGWIIEEVPAHAHS